MYFLLHAYSKLAIHTLNVYRPPLFDLIISEVCGHSINHKFLGGFYIILVLFLGPHLRHMEVPRLGVESEL